MGDGFGDPASPITLVDPTRMDACGVSDRDLVFFSGLKDKLCTQSVVEIVSPREPSCISSVMPVSRKFQDESPSSFPSSNESGGVGVDTQSDPAGA